MSKYSDIIEREFRKRGFKSVSCDDSEPEMFTVDADNTRYICEVGSDDDRFVFQRVQAPQQVSFDIPKDWPA